MIFLKKTLCILTIGLLSIVLVACSNNQEESKETETKPKTENQQPKKEEKSKYPFPESATPVGEGNLVISTPSGDSSDGSAPVLFTSKDDMMVQIGADFEHFQGDKETFVYINEKWNSTEQVGEMSQTSLSLEGDLLKPGKYVVTAVQFEGNDPKNKPVTFVEASYEVKEKSE
jgi:hypothetical protein